MRLTVLFAVLIMIGCNKKTDNIPQAKIAVDTFSQNLIEEEPEDTTTVSFSKTLTGNGYSYTLKGRQNINDGINFKSIDIFHQKKLHQRIIFDTVSVLNESEAYFNVSQDVNFDGFKDLEVINQVGNYWSSSSFWLYNKKTKKYDYYKPMDTIVNPVVDKKNKTITSTYHVDPVNYYYKVYEWKHKKLTMTHYQEDEDNGF